MSQLHHTSLNCMLITADTLYAVCSYDPAAEDDAEEDSYYRLHYKVHDGTVLVASSGWGHGWTEISNNTMLTVKRGTGAMSLHEMARTAAIAASRTTTPRSQGTALA